MRNALPVLIALAMVGSPAVATTSLDPNFPVNVAPVLETVGGNPIQDAIGKLIGTVCPQGVPGIAGVPGVPPGTQDGPLAGVQNQDFQDRCTEIVVAGVIAADDLEGTRGALQAMGAEEGSVVANTEVDFASAHQGRIGKRMANVRAGLTASSVALLGGPASGGNAGSGMGRWSLYVDGSFGRGDKDATSVESGFEMDSRGLTAGMDYQADGYTLIGAAVGYTRLNADLDNRGGDLDTDSVGVYLYGSYFGSPNWYLDGVMGFTNSDHDQTRRLRYTLGTPVNQTASSSNDSNEFSVSLTAGYNYMVGSGWNLSPYGRLDFADVNIDGYSEKMSMPCTTLPRPAGCGLGVHIDDQDYQSLTLALGMGVSTEWNSGGVLWVPQASAELVHEFDNDSDDVTGFFVSDVSRTRFSLPTDSPDRDYFNIGLGIAGYVSDTTSLYVQYSSLVGYRDQNLDELKLGVKFDF